MKKAFIITILLLLVMVSCDYDPVLTAVEQTRRANGYLGLGIIMGSIAFITIVCLCPHKKKVKH